jgi:small subunit ribosomal protein S18
MREFVERKDTFVKVTTVPNYKEPLSLKRFVTDRGKIIPSKRTGVSAKMQRSISKQVKRARFMALLPYTDRHAL